MILKSNGLRFSSWYYKLNNLFLVLAVIDFLFTFFSVYVLKYAVELNPFVQVLTPFGAFFLNLIAYYGFRSGRPSIFSFAFLCFWVAMYTYADLNHIGILVGTFLDGAVPAYTQAVLG